MTYTIQELEAMCETINKPQSIADYVHATADLQRIGPVAIPELIARIRELDPDFHATPAQESVARATELMREAGEKRAKLERALSEAKLGNTDELRSLGLEAFFDVDGHVKIRQRTRQTT